MVRGEVDYALVPVRNESVSDDSREQSRGPFVWVADGLALFYDNGFSLYCIIALELKCYIILVSPM